MGQEAYLLSVHAGDDQARHWSTGLRGVSSEKLRSRHNTDHAQ